MSEVIGEAKVNIKAGEDIIQIQIGGRKHCDIKSDKIKFRPWGKKKLLKKFKLI